MNNLMPSYSYRYSKYALICFNLTFLLFVSNKLQAQKIHSKLIEYSFSSNEKKVLPGNSTDIGSEFGCNRGILQEDVIGNFAIASELYQNACYTDGRYNNNDYQVEMGKITSQDGKNSMTAYKVYAPKKIATQFLASQHRVKIKLATQENYTLYSFDEGVINKIADLPLADQDNQGYVKVGDLSISTISKSLVVFALPSSDKISVYHELSADADGALVFSSTNLKVNKTRFKVDGKPFDTANGFNEGPVSHANVYGLGRQFFSFTIKNQLYVAWQNLDDKSVTMSQLNVDKGEAKHISLIANSGSLAGVTTDGTNIYYLIVNGKTNKVTVTIYKVNASGKLLKKNSYDTSKAGMNMYSYSESESASLVFNGDKLGLIISRKMHKGRDGLNHQGAIALSIDANSLELIKNFGQTSGHSFDNILYPDQTGNFIGIDMGDNYPRGINLHQIGVSKRSKVVFAFKTAHGTTAQSPAGARYPSYGEISGSQQFYKWSNDNHTYSELGGIASHDDAYSIFFVGEPDARGRAINNGRAIGYQYDARNIGYVKVKKNISTDTDYFLSNGVDETAGFYTFGGTWSNQENKGIVWLTNYTDSKTENVSRLKAVKSKSGSILLWEKWTETGYVSTYYMRVDDNGKALSNPTEIGSHLRLNRRDEPININGRIFYVFGNAAEQKLEVVEFID